MLLRKDFSLAQTGFLYGTGHYSRVAPLAQTWITGLLAYNKPKRQGRQGGRFARNDKFLGLFTKPSTLEILKDSVMDLFGQSLGYDFYGRSSTLLGC